MDRNGRLMSFLLIWQTMIQAPLVIASGSIGFAQYLSYIVPLDDIAAKSHPVHWSFFLPFSVQKNLHCRKNLRRSVDRLLGTMAWFIFGGFLILTLRSHSVILKGVGFYMAFWVALGRARSIDVFVSWVLQCQSPWRRDTATGKKYTACHFHFDIGSQFCIWQCSLPLSE